VDIVQFFLNSLDPSSLAEVIVADDLTRSINVDDTGISKDAQVIGYPGDQRCELISPTRLDNESQCSTSILTGDATCLFRAA
jgi:hypothetical protein